MLQLLRGYDSGNVPLWLSYLGFPLVAVLAGRRTMARFAKAAAPLLSIIILIVIVPAALADEAASGLYVPGNFGFGAGVTPGPACISAQDLATTTALSRFTLRAGKLLLTSISDRSPPDSQPCGFLKRKSWAARSDCPSVPLTISRLPMA